MGNNSSKNWCKACLFMEGSFDNIILPPNLSSNLNKKTYRTYRGYHRQQLQQEWQKSMLICGS